MNTDRLGMVLGAIAALNEAGSPSTRTHIQKLLYFAESWGLVPASHEFVLHLHGPYAFDLDRDIAELEAFGHVTSQPNPSGYGARYSAPATEPAPELRRLAVWLGPKLVRELEALATCQFTEDEPGGTLVERVREIKPHLSKSEVEAAYAELKKERAALKESGS